MLQLLIKQAHPPRPDDRYYAERFGDNFELPKRILRSFASTDSENEESRWAREATAMGFLRYLLSPIELPDHVRLHNLQSHNPKNVTLSGNSNSHDGYFLRQAVQLDHEPLVELLLAHGCDPLQKAGLAVQLAISELLCFSYHSGSLCLYSYVGRKDARMVRKLILKSDFGRLYFGPVARHLLAYSAQVEAREIVDFFINEMRIAPDPETLKLLSRRVD